MKLHRICHNGNLKYLEFLLKQRGMNFLGNSLYEALITSRIEATLGCGFQDRNEAQLLNGPVKNRMKMPRIPTRGTGEETGAYIIVRGDFLRRYPLKLYYMNEDDLVLEESF